MGAVAVLFTVMFATATSLMADTPLYTFRMEQASSKMNFLPTETSSFTYTAEIGCTVTYAVERYCGFAMPLMTTPYDTLCETCGPETCDTCQTCEETCEETCYPTCQNTCWQTCNDPTCPGTCPVTCSTCNPTCTEPTCPTTCWDTCSFSTCAYSTCPYSTCFYSTCHNSTCSSGGTCGGITC
jgi:hypothetical protein